MPVHPSEETAPDNLTDKVAAESKDSTASDHPLHNENKVSISHGGLPGEGGVGAFQAQPGPERTDKVPTETKSKDELNAEAKKLNE